MTDETMEQMIESSVSHCVPAPYPNPEAARAEMMKFFPQLRCRKK